MIMKILNFIFVLLIIYFAFVYGRYKYVVVRADLPQIKQSDRTIGAGAPLRYIAAGDSTAVGEGASSVEKTYTYRLADFLAQKYLVDYHNMAVVGDKTSDLVQNQLPAIIAFNPDIVTISVGANDINHWVASDQILANYKTIIATLTTKTTAKIYITDIPGLQNAKILPFWYRSWIDWRAKKLNLELLALETDRVKFIDIHEFG